MATEKGKSLSLGDTSVKDLRTFTFEPLSLLVGFYGTRKDWQINSLGLIYLDPTCVLQLPEPAKEEPKQSLSVTAIVTICVLALGLIAALITICFLCDRKSRNDSKMKT